MNLEHIKKQLDSSIISLWVPGGPKRAIDLVRGNEGRVIGAKNCLGCADLGWSFDGDNDYIDCGSDGSLLIDAFVYSAWIKPVLKDVNCILGFSTSDKIGFNFPALLTYNRPIFQLNSLNFRYFKSNDPVDILDGNWHFVSCVITGWGQDDIDNSKLYVDGQEQAVYSTVKTTAPATKTVFYIGKGVAPFLAKGHIALPSFSKSMSFERHANFWRATRGLFSPRA